jgi:hypothetical protein
MTQFNPYGDTYLDPSVGQRRTSGLAITSLVFSLIVCCPLTTIIGPLLGLIAIASIGSNPLKKGKGLALIAIIVGVLVTSGYVWVGVHFYHNWKRFEDTPRMAIAAGYAGDLTRFKATFGGPATPDAEAQAFIEQMRTRFGNPQRSDVDFNAFVTAMQQQRGQARPGQLQSLDFKFRIVFDKATVDADLPFDPGKQVTDDPVFDAITLDDGSGHPLSFPSSASIGSTSAPSASKPSRGSSTRPSSSSPQPGSTSTNPPTTKSDGG